VLLVARRHSLLRRNLFYPVASAIDLCREVIGEAAVSKLELESLSNNAITRRIIEMSDDIECQLFGRIKSSPY